MGAVGGPTVDPEVIELGEGTRVNGGRGAGTSYGATFVNVQFATSSGTTHSAFAPSGGSKSGPAPFAGGPGPSIPPDMNPQMAALVNEALRAAAAMAAEHPTAFANAEAAAARGEAVQMPVSDPVVGHLARLGPSTAGANSPFKSRYVIRLDMKKPSVVGEEGVGKTRVDGCTHVGGVEGEVGQ